MSSPLGSYRLAVPVAMVTILALGAQLLTVGAQVVIAAAFGARPEMDAFLAANTLPQYLVVVLLSALPVVFVPVFIEYDGSGRSAEGWTVASTVVTGTVVLLAGFAVLGVVWAEPLIRWTTPGLSQASLAVAVRVARVTWPAVAATGAIGLLTGLCHARAKFTWPAVVSTLGGALNLGLVVVLARRGGVIGVAVASAAATALQAILLLRNIAGRERLRFAFDWRHPGVHRVVSLVWPLVVSGLLIRYTPVVDRFLASNLPQGSIAHLGYAFRLVSILGLLLSTGISTVAFPRMAMNTASMDMPALRRTISRALRMMWLGVAPVMAIGMVLARPIVTYVFEHGKFSPADSAAVAAVLRVYLLSLLGSCLGSVTGRTFYALKATRIVAVMGVVEALGYAAYTTWLASRYGVPGVAFGYVLYFSLSLVWQVPVLYRMVGRVAPWRFVGSFVRTGTAALLGAALSLAVAAGIPHPVWLQIVAAGASGLLLFGASLWLVDAAEVRELIALVLRRPADVSLS